MKVRNKTKAVTATPWTDAEVAAFDDVINTHQSTLDILAEAARLMDAQPVPQAGRMVWDGKKMHGAQDGESRGR